MRMPDFDGDRDKFVEQTQVIVMEAVDRWWW